MVSLQRIMLLRHEKLFKVSQIYVAEIFMTKAVGEFHRADPNEIYKATVI
jgi:hypothetical protein